MTKPIARFLFLTSLVPHIAFTQPGVTSDTYDEIQAKVNEIFGAIYEVQSIKNIDSSFFSSRILNSHAEDPYGTLRGCFVFAAVGKERDDDYTYKGFVGVYKNNQIIWRSDTVINDDVARGATIAATMDLNNDGTVDIVTDWSQDSRWGPDYLWIFNWDGTTGRLINDLDEFGYSVIVSVGGGLMEFADVDGDGVIEIKGFWSQDSRVENVNSPVIYSWNGQLYGKWPTTPIPLPSGYLPRNKLSATVRASGRGIENGLVYRYSVHNAATSLQKIDEVLLLNRTGTATKGSGRKNWRFALMKRSLMGWTNLFIQPNPISQGETDASFRYESTGLPFVSMYYVRGHNPTLQNPPYDEEASFRDKFENSVRGFTLGPADPPSPFVTSAFVDTLLSYTKQARSLNWIDSDGLANSFSQKLQNAKEQLSKGNANAARNTLQALLNEVEAQKEKHLTSEAYALLKFNAEYLISKL